MALESINNMYDLLFIVLFTSLFFPQYQTFNNIFTYMLIIYILLQGHELYESNVCFITHFHHLRQSLTVILTEITNKVFIIDF